MYAEVGFVSCAHKNVGARLAGAKRTEFSEAAAKKNHLFSPNLDSPTGLQQLQSTELLALQLSVHATRARISK